MNDAVKTYVAPRARQVDLRKMPASQLLKLFEDTMQAAALRLCAPRSVNALRQEVARRLDRAVDNVNG